MMKPHGKLHNQSRKKSNRGKKKPTWSCFFRVLWGATGKGRSSSALLASRLVLICQGTLCLPRAPLNSAAALRGFR